MRALLSLLVLSACAGVPELEARLTEAESAAPPPALLPVADLLARADAPGPGPVAPVLSGRAAVLAARAAALRGPVLDPADRARLTSLPAPAPALP